MNADYSYRFSENKFPFLFIFIEIIIFAIFSKYNISLAILLAIIAFVIFFGIIRNIELTESIFYITNVFGYRVKINYYNVFIFGSFPGNRIFYVLINNKFPFYFQSDGNLVDRIDELICFFEGKIHKEKNAL